MAAEPVKLNLAQKKALKEANEGPKMKEYLTHASKVAGRPVTFEWTAEANLAALKGTKGEEYAKDTAIISNTMKYLNSLCDSNFKHHAGSEQAFLDAMKQYWTTDKFTFTIMPEGWKPAATDAAWASSSHCQNGIRIVDGTLDIWCPANQFNCGPDLLTRAQADNKIYRLFDNLVKEGEVHPEARADIAKFAPDIKKHEEELVKLGAPADFKFDVEGDFLRVSAAKPTTAPVNISKLNVYYSNLVSSLKHNGMNDADIKEAILDVWKGKVRVEIVDSLAAQPNPKEINTYNGVRFDGETMVVMIEKQRWACASETLAQVKWVKLF